MMAESIIHAKSSKSWSLHAKIAILAGSDTSTATYPSLPDALKHALRLSDAPYRVFGAFILWTVRGRFVSDLEHQDMPPILVELWIFCNNLGWPKLQNGVMNTLIELFAVSRCPMFEVDVVEYVYFRTIERSLLRLFLADFVALSYFIIEHWEGLIHSNG
jgi:hypothetical protein